MKNMIIVLGLLGLASCASAPLTKEEQSVKVLRKSDAGNECQELGRVHSSMSSFEDQTKENDVKKASFAMGGDTVQVMPRDENSVVHGIAYKCKK